MPRRRLRWWEPGRGAGTTQAGGVARTRRGGRVIAPSPNMDASRCGARQRCGAGVPGPDPSSPRQILPDLASSLAIDARASPRQSPEPLRLLFIPPQARPRRARSWPNLAAVARAVCMACWAWLRPRAVVPSVSRVMAKSELSHGGWATDGDDDTRRHRGGVLGRVGGGSFLGSVVLGDRRLS